MLWQGDKSQERSSAATVLQCRESHIHVAKLSVATLRQADAPLLTNPRRNCALCEHTWFLCRVPSSSSEELFMIPHRSFTILRRICASQPPVYSRRGRKRRFLSLYLRFSLFHGKINGIKEGGTTTSVAQQPHTPRKLRTDMKLKFSPEGPDYQLFQWID